MQGPWHDTSTASSSTARPCQRLVNQALLFKGEPYVAPERGLVGGVASVQTRSCFVYSYILRRQRHGFGIRLALNTPPCLLPGLPSCLVACLQPAEQAQATVDS